MHFHRLARLRIGIQTTRSVHIFLQFREHPTGWWKLLSGPTRTVFIPLSANENIGSTRVDSARVAIVPQETTPFRIVFDFAPKLDLPTRITYQPIVRNGSEIFRIVGCGQVSGLQRAIENGTASLGDRDEQGRPLLYVS
jgi:hypothetical protein